MIIDIDPTEAFIFIVTMIFGLGVKVARDEYLNRENKRDHQKLASCINKIMEHFGLKDGLEDLNHNGRKRK